ncbi:MAG: glycosyltransferase, partial [Acidobacteriota bacterium]|nr:glycosyltransferase [Acidobacteriota bacterium]
MQKVSVIIPTYNYAHFIGEAIESILAQTFPLSEIIVVDDGSTDNTEQIVAKYGNKVRYIKQENSGVCAARNFGVKNSSGDFIAFFDADDICFPAKIEKQMAKFAEDAKIGLVHCGMREFDLQGNTIRYHLEGRKEGWIADEILLLMPVITASGSSIMVSREAFNAVGGFDTNLTVGEDWDFCYRVARKFKVGFVPEILVDYRYHGKNTHLNLMKMERSMKIAFEKAFDTDDEKILRLRQKSYGNFYKTLAGSYFTAGNYQRFIRYSLKSLRLMPENIYYFSGFPLRKIRRNRENTKIINEVNFSNNVTKSSLPPILDRRTMQKISVVIPTYNYADFIAEAVKSVLAQTFPIFETIVVDDGSSDNTEEVIAKFGDKVKYIKQKNGGVCAARNNGVKNAGGDFIAFLDADDAWLPEKIEKQIAKFNEDDQIG